MKGVRAMLTIEQLIARYDKMAKFANGNEYLKKTEAVNRQTADLLRELQERRKAPEIIRCGECKHFRQEPDGEMWCGVSKGHGIDKDFFCADAERRTDGA